MSSCNKTFNIFEKKLEIIHFFRHHSGYYGIRKLSKHLFYFFLVLCYYSALYCYSIALYFKCIVLYLQKERLLSDIGGSLGLFIGVSICSAIEIMEFFTDFVIMISRKCKKKKRAVTPVKEFKA